MKKAQKQFVSFSFFLISQRNRAVAWNNNVIKSFIYFLFIFFSFKFDFFNHLTLKKFFNLIVSIKKNKSA